MSEALTITYRAINACGCVYDFETDFLIHGINIENLLHEIDVRDGNEIQPEANIDVHVDEVFACLESEFLVMPKGPGFVEYTTFEKGYEALKQATTDFQ